MERRSDRGRHAGLGGRTVAVAAVAVLAGACAGDTPPVTSEKVPPAITMGPRSTTPGTASPGPQANSTDGNGVTIAFAGDVHFAGRVEPRLGDPTTALGPISQTLSRADIAMVNLETAITTGGTPEPKSFHFRAPASAFEALRAAGVDVTTMANNHAVDYGPDGLNDSLTAISTSRFPVVGIGKDAETAYAPWYTTVRGRRVAILGASQVPDRTLQAWTATPDSPGIASASSNQLADAVRQARTKADIVVVYVHWGEEGNACPLAEQRSLVSTLADAGADAVVGTHAHLLLGGGWKGNTYVAYGLGNFLWWRDNAFSNDTGVLTLTFRGRTATRADFTPALIDSRGVPMPTEGTEQERISSKWDSARGCTDLSDAAGG